MTTETTLDPQESFQNFFKKQYRRLIKQMALNEKCSLVVDFINLAVFDNELALNLQNNPETYIRHASDGLFAQLKIEAPEYVERIQKSNLYVRFKGLPTKVPLRTIGADNIQRFISFDGIVVRASPVKPLLVEAAFECKCGEINMVLQSGPSLFIRSPKRCKNLNCRRERFELNIEQSRFLDFQELKLQERPEDLPPGQLPRSIETSLFDDIVDIARPGDRVTVTGIVRARPEFIPGKGRLKIFNVFIDANHVETVEKEADVVEITPEDENKIKELSKREFIFRDIIKSVAPSIYGYEDIKEAIVYLLFGGIPKLTHEGVSIRGDIHVLLVGDPGIAKSQLLRYATKISPRGLYTSGRGTTAAGLTAAVMREKAGGMVLEAGALVLADKGVAAVDEIDKMRDEDRIAMHEVMEQQTVSIAKGGIIATLNARTSILAAANPKLGRYEDRLSAIDNTNIPIVILSRFDLIFVKKDRPEKDTDEKLSEHILNVHRTIGSSINPPLDSETLRKYISYARSRVHPKLSNEVVKRLRDFYLKMRALSAEAEEAMVAITPRQLEALIRISEARARVALRDTVTAMDAEAAIKIMQKSLHNVGAISEAELVDIDVIMTGKPATVREGIATVLKLVSEIEKDTGEVELEKLYRRLEDEYKMDRITAEEYMGRLVRDGGLYKPKDGYVKKSSG
ncbi:MAG: minichromosome maintenance protein MCM [Candidatus Bathyarchaeota archaeon]